jgi:hypothetical protein
MKTLSSSLFLYIFIVFQLTSCSSTPLQSKRLEAAEAHIMQAEQALANSSDDDSEVRVADENLGTATAYLATINDQKKYLSENEMKQFQALKQRAKDLSRRIR